MENPLPKIPGFELSRMLSENESVQIFQGTVTGSPRQIAVKFLPKVKPPEISATDPAIYLARGQAFVGSAAIQAGIHHKNVAQVLDYGETSDGWYQVLEYAPGSDLNTRLAGGIHVQGLLKTVKDIARALDSVNQAGVVHADIKPENILFRANGTAILADFGNARMTGEASMPLHAANDDETTDDTPPVLKIVGTPEYMSPEQATGKPLDGRSDLYSLGIVLYRVLTGSVPYRADSAVTSSIKHLQDPIPRLPTHLAVFQRVIDKVLAKRPEQRIQSGAELVALIEDVRDMPALPDLTVKTAPISTREIMLVSGDLLSTPMDSVRAERRFAKRKRRRRVRNTLASLILLGGLGAGSYYIYQQGLISVEEVLTQLNIGEDPQVANAWSEAQSLRQDPNQSLAAIVAAYRRVLAMDPSHNRARDEVANLALDWRESISDALQQGSLELAKTRLEEANTVFPNDVEWVQLKTELQNHQRAERLMLSTESLLASHGLSDLPSATAAIQSFQEVLRLAPGHEAATQALHELGVHYATLARQSASIGQVSSAIGLLERATAADPTLPELDAVRAMISQATTAQAAINDLLQQARRYRGEGQLITPAGENAAELYHRVLATDPDNVFAAQGLDEVTAQVTATANVLLRQGDLPAVELLLNKAASVALNTEVLNELRARIDGEINKQNSIASSLDQAAQLMEIGYLTAPADANAVAFLREVQQLEPGNPTAVRMLGECAQKLADVAQEAQTYGLLDDAKQYLDLALTITPEVAEWVALRSSWEQN